MIRETVNARNAAGVRFAVLVLTALIATMSIDPTRTRARI